MKKFLSLLVFFAAIATAGADAPKVLVYGKILSVTETGLLISCDPATHSHPTGVYNIGASENRIVHVSGDPRTLYSIGRRGALELKPIAAEGLLAFVARDPGEKYTYVTKAGPKNSVASLNEAGDLPHFSVIRPSAAQSSSAPLTGAAVAGGPPRSQFGTVMDTPRYSLDGPADLKIGMRGDKVIQILGNPLRINQSGNNGQQWCYPGGQIYIENGFVTAMQNYAGDVFDATWIH